jgi:hypothetical protein
MKTRIPTLFTLLGLALALPLPGLFAVETKPAKSVYIPGREIVKTRAATIQAINHETRELTLVGQEGNVLTLVADPQIQRLTEFKVGDEIVLDYSVSVAAELRTPTAEELAKPLVVTEDTTRAAADKAPGVHGYRIVEAVVSIEGLDRQTQTVTVKGPKGNYTAIRVKDPTTLDKLRLGEIAFVVYTESFALRIERAPAKAKP